MTNSCPRCPTRSDRIGCGLCNGPPGRCGGDPPKKIILRPSPPGLLHREVSEYQLTSAKTGTWKRTLSGAKSSKMCQMFKGLESTPSQGENIENRTERCREVGVCGAASCEPAFERRIAVASRTSLEGGSSFQGWKGRFRSRGQRSWCTLC